MNLKVRECLCYLFHTCWRIAWCKFPRTKVRNYFQGLAVGDGKMSGIVSRSFF